MKNKQCGNCGKKTMQLQQVLGTFSWKDFSSITLLEPIELLKCTNCNEIGLRPKDSGVIDHAAEATIRSLTGKLITTILERENCSQLTLAERVGITPEYLSGIKTGTRTPGFQTFNILKIFAEEHSAFEISDPTFTNEELFSDIPVESYREVLRKLA